MARLNRSYPADSTDSSLVCLFLLLREAFDRTTIWNMPSVPSVGRARTKSPRLLNALARSDTLMRSVRLLAGSTNLRRAGDRHDLLSGTFDSESSVGTEQPAPRERLGELRSRVRFAQDRRFDSQYGAQRLAGDGLCGRTARPETENAVAPKQFNVPTFRA